MRGSDRSERTRAAALMLGAALVLAACSTPKRPAPAPASAKIGEGRIELDPSLSPVAFRWLSEDTLLVAPTVGKRKLASLGNYFARAAKSRARLRLAVWDDEAAWKASRGGKSQSEEVLGHKRALYVKNTSGSTPVDSYQTFDEKGEVVYDRDFRTWPLAETDDE